MFYNFFKRVVCLKYNMPVDYTVHTSIFRTKAVHEEKSKMEHLLSALLPKSVAENLKLGHSVQPEFFDQVTLLFSDIVSFTRISAAGTAIDVVRMLNLMYTLFDDISARYDVYKVATIGDAYFVASGVPVRNGEMHAKEVACMALQLLRTVKDLRIPHLPDETLQMRLGIHSGPCVAGVAGIKMPRYMLFGDTVDIASGLEACSDSMRILISQSTVDILNRTTHCSVSLNGVKTIKGVTLKVYWLLG